jgi:hypothetical protein
MHTETHTFVFTKDSQRKLNEKAVGNNVAHMLGVNNKSLAAKGWMIDAHNSPAGVNWDSQPLMDDSPNEYRYRLHFIVAYKSEQEPGKSELKAIAKSMNTRGANPLGGRWTLTHIDGKPYEVTDDGTVMSTKDFTAYADFELPGDFEDHFDHLYGLGSHIGRLKKAIEVAVQSQFEKRYHVAFIGKPGCGKSDICETLAAMLGDDAVMKFDATATTAAGAIKQLDEAEILPRILVVEEIEKVNAEALSFLLALMDMRGEIRKTTARQKIVKDTKILVVATVNNHELFDNMLAGALSSRFSNKCWFKRPEPEVIARILRREISTIDGDTDWIAPVMAYAREKDITDPRMISALALCGQDGWLDGSYIQMLADTDKPQDY